MTEEGAPKSSSPEEATSAEGDSTDRSGSSADLSEDNDVSTEPSVEASARLHQDPRASGSLPVPEDVPAAPPASPAAAEVGLTFWAAEAWGQAARATSLTALIGMALVIFTRFVTEDGWLHDFLKRNKMGMDDRMTFLAQMVGGGGALAAMALAYVLYTRRQGRLTTIWERWTWFLSPLILLPAIPVVLAHEVWHGRHEDLLPVVLFGALIAEVLFSKAYSNVPPWIERMLQRFHDWDRPEGSESSKVSAFLSRHSALITVVVCAVAYGAFMSFFTVRWHHKLGTATFDLGINNNLIYGGLEGRFNQSPVIFPDDPQKYLANHVKIGLYTFLPIYALYPKAETLLVIQSVSMGLGAIPLFLFVRKRVPEWWAAALALSYLAYYPLHGANFYEMKLPPTAAAIVLLAIYGIDAKKWILGGICFLWAMIMREDMPVPLAVVGAVFLLSGHRPRAGFLMAAVATTWFIFLRFRFMNEVGNWWFPNMYEDLWAEPDRGFKGVVKTLVTNPTFTLKHILVEKKFWYLLHLLIPLAFLPVRRWWGWAAMIPGAILTLLVTDYDPPIIFSFQYVMHWAPYLYLATGLVLASISHESGRARAKGALTALCLSSAALSYNYGAFSLRDRALESGYHKIEFSMSAQERKTYEDVKRLVASIPKNASVGSTERIGAHLSSRTGFYTLRRGSHGVDYMVARKSALRLDRTKQTIHDGLASGEYGVVGRFGEFIVFKRGADTKQNEQVIDEWNLSGKRRRSARNRKAPARSPGEDEEKSPSNQEADRLEDEGEEEEEDPSDGVLQPLHE